MRKTLFLMLALALWVGQLVASPVSVEKARQLGMKYVRSNASKQVTELNHVYTEMTESGAPALYVFNFDGGFIIVSADDVAQPILSFGEEGTFDAANIHDGIAYYLRHYARQIDYAVTNHLEPEAETQAQWRHVAEDGFVCDPVRGTRNIAPLVTTNWDQGNPYNRLCPAHNSGPGGHVYAGCVATAMSMVMKYWNWPTQGNGTHSYTPEGFPTQNVNFGTTTYDWNNMPNALSYNSTNAQIQAVGTLMWHCGVSVDMMYGYASSGAHSQDVPDALSDYFRYTSYMQRLERNQYMKAEWEAMLLANLELGFPLYYSGTDLSSDGGHAFVCDGYRESDNKFHFNWGWSGSFNNYFAIDALNTYSGYFNDNQSAIFDMVPDYIFSNIIAGPEDLSIEATNVHSKEGIITWTNPTMSLDSTVLTNIDQVLLFRSGVQVFSQNNVTPGETMQFVDNVPNYDCYTYSVYYIQNGQRGKVMERSYQFGPTCTWKIVGQTTNFQGWNKGKLQLVNGYGSVVSEFTMTSSTPVSEFITVPEGDISFRWVAPASAINVTINIKNSSNTSVYQYSGSTNGLSGTLYTGSNDCDGCQPPTEFYGEYQWTNEGFGTLLSWNYESEPQSFKLYRSVDGVNYEVVATIDKAAREYFDITDAGDYYYKLTAFRSICESTPAWVDEDTDYLHIQVTSVSEDAIEGYKVYPNPAHALMSIEAEGLQQVTIHNVTGQMVYTQQCSEDGVVINTSSLPSGVYTISIKAAQGTVTKRFAVMH